MTTIRLALPLDEMRVMVEIPALGACPRRRHIEDYRTPAATNSALRLGAKAWHWSVAPAKMPR